MSNFQALQEYATQMKELANNAETAAANHRWVELLAMGERINELVCKTVMALMVTPPPSESGKEQYGMPLDQPAAISTYIAMRHQLAVVDHLVLDEKAKVAEDTAAAEAAAESQEGDEDHE